ncbi:oligosaccharide flippase family protein [Alteribacillus sp. HJP-4]|uniref:putative polysaccharide biosynthesis protein n=1 Tax=Alteribacillus sp. HJP-4 TaxID=2775394 RepID=UPI0035CD134F
MSEEYIKSRDLLKGAALVSGVALLGKVLSALYRVPYQNITGDIGYYVYQQVYPFYGAAMMISMYGFPVILSKLVAEAREKKGIHYAQETAAAAFIMLAVLSFFVSGCLYFLAGPIAGAMGDIQLTGPLQITALAFVVVPYLSGGRGYFQGVDDLKPTAYSHLLEQFIRVAAILLLAALAVSLEKGPYGAGQGAALGSLLGAFAGAALLIFTLKKKQIPFRKIFNKHILSKVLQHRLLLQQGLLVCAGAMVFILYQMADAFTVVRELQQSGLPAATAKLEKGIFDRAMPLLQFGSVIASSLAMAIVPILTREKTSGNIEAYKNYGTSILRVSLLIGGAAAVGLAAVAEPANHMLFENNEGTEVLKIHAAALLFSGVTMTSAAVLQSHDYFWKPALHLAAGLVLKITANLLLIPVWGTMGAAGATVAGLLLTAVLNVSYLWKKSLVSSIKKSWYGRSGAALLIMLAAVSGIITIFSAVLPEGRLWESLLALTASGAGVLIFAGMSRALSLFTETELAFIPGAQKLERFFSRKER